VKARFPLARPTWPGGVERPPVARRTGLDFDTDWARTPAARYARGLLVEWVMRPALAAVAGPRIDGLDRIADLPAPAIFAANHHSHVDTPLVLVTLPERFRHRTAVAAAADYFFDSRWKGALSALAMAAVPIDRSRVSRRSADLAASLLDDGWSLVIFPEGGRSPDGWGQEFRGGAAYLSQRCSVPVVPVHLEGTGRILAKGARRLTPSTVRVTYGGPMVADQGEDTRRFAARIERVVAALADERATDWWTARRRAAAGLTPALTGPTATGAWRRAWALGDRTRSAAGAGHRRRSTGPTWP
jgi:1-acyl-sn-glycerol-3-phosphate acyltransferase